MKANFDKEIQGISKTTFAGIAIGLGCCLFLLAPNNIIGAVLFSCGLLCVRIYKLTLFTGKVQFLILQCTNSDYRITFLATEKKWSTILTGVKGVTIPKNAKGNKWLKYVNKGIGETSVIKSFIRESVKGANEEIANILKAKEEEKQRRAEAKNKLESYVI